MLPAVVKHTLDVVFPPQCLGCRGRVGEVGSLCHACWEHIHFIAAPQCQTCGIPFELEAAEGMLCGECIRQPPLYDRARAVFVYDDKSAPFITSFKYGDTLHGRAFFANWMVRAGQGLLEESDVIAPVPLHRLRLFMRRYNQSALLAGALSKATGKPVWQDMLVRKKYTTPQAGLSRRARRLNVRNAFTLNPRYRQKIQAKRVLLIDDVMTTGSTVNACAKALKKAGVAQVNILTLAVTIT